MKDLMKEKFLLLADKLQARNIRRADTGGSFPSMI